ncbi:hypothetical protein V1524DRAFT_411698 [Lipomyces starkeyi]
MVEEQGNEETGLAEQLHGGQGQRKEVTIEAGHGKKLDDYHPEDVLNMTEDEFARYEVLVAQAEKEKRLQEHRHARHI